MAISYTAELVLVGWVGGGGFLPFSEKSPSNEMPKGGIFFVIECTKDLSEFRGPQNVFKIPPKCYKLMLPLYCVGVISQADYIIGYIEK